MSLYGSRGAMMAHFHWDWDYINRGIRWPILQRILSDMPKYKKSKGDGKKSSSNQNTGKVAGVNMNEQQLRERIANIKKGTL